MDVIQPTLFLFRTESPKVLDLSETDKAYLAGLIDGEGCISILKTQSKRTPTPIYHLVLVIASCDRDVLEYWQVKTGWGKIKQHKHSQGNWRDGYSWWMTSRQAASLLQEVYSYLMLKREQADIALVFQSTMGGHQKGGRGRTYEQLRLEAEIVHQRERYKQALSRMKGYKSRRGRPPAIREGQIEQL